jgi:hypothetical protein
MTDKAEQIAAGLTEAHITAILADPNSDMPSQVALDFMALRLFRPTSIEPPRMAWTPLGQQVRKILIRESQS